LDLLSQCPLDMNHPPMASELIVFTLNTSMASSTLVFLAGGVLPPFNRAVTGDDLSSRASEEIVLYPVAVWNFVSNFKWNGVIAIHGFVCSVAMYANLADCFSKNLLRY
jgi:hypothetical protein